MSPSLAAFLRVRNTQDSSQHSRSLRPDPSATERYHACFRANSIERFMNTWRRSMSFMCRSFNTSPCVELMIASLLTVSIVRIKSSYVDFVSKRISDKMPMLSRRSEI